MIKRKTAHAAVDSGTCSNTLWLHAGFEKVFMQYAKVRWEPTGRDVLLAKIYRRISCFDFEVVLLDCSFKAVSPPRGGKSGRHCFHLHMVIGSQKHARLIESDSSWCWEGDLRQADQEPTCSKVTQHKSGYQFSEKKNRNGTGTLEFWNPGTLLGCKASKS